MTQSSVTSRDGTRIAIQESGRADGPILIAVHGYPDNHTVWDGVRRLLDEDFRVITYDVRGAGDSDKPAQRAAYRIDRLVEDFAAVAAAVSPNAPVHLLAHDWGSIQSWGSVVDPVVCRRIASFTSISGPHIDYAGAWMRERGHPRASLQQLLHSWYILAFQLPRLPEFLVRRGAVDRMIARTELGGDPGGSLRNPVERSEADRVNGINLYRANFVPRLLRPRPVATDVPVQVLAPIGDAFAGVPVVTEAPARYVRNLTVHTLPGSHWVVAESPDRIAGYVRDFAAAHPIAGPDEESEAAR